MEIKFKKALTEFDCLVMFDLASKVSGVCLWDLRKNAPIKTSVLKVSGSSESPVAELWGLIDSYFGELNKISISSDRVLVAKEAMPTQLRGGSSTVQTFLALARSHATLDLYLQLHGIAAYDHVGVYPISTHAYLKKLNGWEAGHPVEKIDIREFVEREYGLMGLTLDESDSVFLAKTFVDVKWNKDIDERIREVKRHKKGLKAPHAIASCDDEIARLASLKNI